MGLRLFLCKKCALIILKIRFLLGYYVLIRLSFNVSCRPFKKEVLVPGRHKRVSPPTVTHNRHALFMIFVKLLHSCVHPLRVGHVLNLFRWLWSHLSSPLLNKSTLPRLQSSLQTLPLHPLGAPRPPQTPCSPTASWPRDSRHLRMFWAGLVYSSEFLYFITEY